MHPPKTRTAQVNKIFQTTYSLSFDVNMGGYSLNHIMSQQNAYFLATGRYETENCVSMSIETDLL